MNPKIVIGTWPMSGDYGKVQISELQKIIDKCSVNGYHEFDTAPNYGKGLSELLIGNFFPNEVLVNTKVGNSVTNKKNFNPSSMLIGFSESLKRLKKEKINCLFLHNPRSEIDNYEAIFEFADKLKEEDQINEFGISTAKSYDYNEDVIKQFDSIQFDYNLLYIQDYVKYKNLNLKKYIRSPLASGLLTGKINTHTKFSGSDHRSLWLIGKRLESINYRIKYLLETLNINRDMLIHYAKSFVLSNPKVDKAIFGVRRGDHINIFNDDLIKISSKKIVEIERLNLNNFYLNEKQYSGY